MEKSTRWKNQRELQKSIPNFKNGRVDADSAGYALNSGQAAIDNHCLFLPENRTFSLVRIFLDSVFSLWSPMSEA